MMRAGSIASAWIILAGMLAAQDEVRQPGLEEAVLISRQAGPVDPGLMDETGRPGKPARLTPDQEAGLIDKPHIAAETMGRPRGHRAADLARPGLLIAGVREDPEAIQVDGSKLHDQMVSNIEGHRVAPPGSEGQSEAPARSPPARPATAASSIETLCTAVCALGVFSGAAFIALRRIRRRRDSAAEVHGASRAASFRGLPAAGSFCIDPPRAPSFSSGRPKAPREP
jgi:hypothetical protein